MDVVERLDQVVHGVVGNRQGGGIDEPRHCFCLVVVPAANYDQAKTMPGFVNTPTLSIAYYTMNYLVKPFDNIHIRQAFSMAINKDIITQAIYKGLYVPTCHIVPQGMPGFNSNLTCPGGVSTADD